MRKSNLMEILTIVALLLISGTVSAFEINKESLDHDAYWYTTGGAYADAEWWPYAYAYAFAAIVGSETDEYGEAFGYDDRICYITNYDPETDPILTATVDGYCEAEVWADGMTAYSDYNANAFSDGYGGDGYCWAYVSISEPDTSDTDSDGFVEYVDMSYNGATVYYGHSAISYAGAYSTSYRVRCEATAGSQTFVTIDEE